MNKPLTDAELQHRMMAHTAEVVATITGLFTTPPRRMHESDNSHTARTEAEIQAMFIPALAKFKSICQDAQALTGSREVKDMFRVLLNALGDNAPTVESWAKAIAEGK